MFILFGDRIGTLVAVNPPDGFQITRDRDEAGVMLLRLRVVELPPVDADHQLRDAL